MTSINHRKLFFSIVNQPCAYRLLLLLPISLLLASLLAGIRLYRVTLTCLSLIVLTREYLNYLHPVIAVTTRYDRCEYCVLSGLPF